MIARHSTVAESSRELVALVADVARRLLGVPGGDPVCDPVLAPLEHCCDRTELLGHERLDVLVQRHVAQRDRLVRLVHRLGPQRGGSVAETAGSHDGTGRPWCFIHAALRRCPELHFASKVVWSQMSSVSVLVPVSSVKRYSPSTSVWWA